MVNDAVTDYARADDDRAGSGREGAGRLGLICQGA
jgi:hypothetical protein